MRVSALYRYPVKSLGGEALSEATPAERGLVDDRRWMLVDADGRFISQRAHPHLARFYARIDGHALRLYTYDEDRMMYAVDDARPQTEPDLTVTLWDDTFLASRVRAPKIGNVLGLDGGTRLVYMNAATTRPADPRYADGTTVSFADGYPYLIATDASLDDLSERTGEPLDMLRFRPNIVVEGTEAFAEDGWKELQIGNHKFLIVKPCARCIMITHEPETGERNLRVLSELATYRKVGNKVLFGQNATWRGGREPLRVGDTVRITTRRETPAPPPG